MTFSGRAVVRRVDWKPITAGQPDFNPGVALAGSAKGLIRSLGSPSFPLGFDIAADIAGRYLRRTEDRDHDMRKILADPFAIAEDIADLGVNRGAPRLVGEGPVDPIEEPEDGLAQMIGGAEEAIGQPIHLTVENDGPTGSEKIVETDSPASVDLPGFGNRDGEGFRDWIGGEGLDFALTDQEE